MARCPFPRPVCRSRRRLQNTLRIAAQIERYAQLGTACAHASLRRRYGSTVYFTLNTGTMQAFWAAAGLPPEVVTVLDVNAAPTAQDPFAAVQVGFQATEAQIVSVRARWRRSSPTMRPLRRSAPPPRAASSASSEARGPFMSMTIKAAAAGALLALSLPVAHADEVCPATPCAWVCTTSITTRAPTISPDRMCPRDSI